MKLAILGYGTVGQHVCKILEESSGVRERFQVKYILRRPGKTDGPKMVSDYDSILTDPEVDAIVDVLPGVEPSLRYMKQALLAGKHVVSANKAALCEGLPELLSAAKEGHAALLYEASCGGALPILTQTRALAAVDEITEVSGILNGTCNYILYRMEREGLEFAEALSSAQQLGYAEADPTADINGYDVRNKLVLLAATAYGGLLTKDVPTAGIERVSKAVLDRFQKEGKTVKLMALSRREASRYALGVVPVLLPSSAQEAQVPDNYNIASVTGNFSGTLKFYGQGAGGYPTADAIVRDLMQLPGESFCASHADLPEADYSRALCYDEALLTGNGYLFSETGQPLMQVKEQSLSALCQLAKQREAFLVFAPDSLS